MQQKTHFKLSQRTLNIMMSANPQIKVSATNLGFNFKKRDLKSINKENSSKDFLPEISEFDWSASTAAQSLRQSICPSTKVSHGGII
mgnify:CR=1 FL=1